MAFGPFELFREEGYLVNYLCLCLFQWFLHLEFAVSSMFVSTFVFTSNACYDFVKLLVSLQI